MVEWIQFKSGQKKNVLPGRSVSVLWQHTSVEYNHRVSRLHWSPEKSRIKAADCSTCREGQSSVERKGLREPICRADGGWDTAVPHQVSRCRGGED